ncbi:hypothetical protein VCR6J2_610261 [Vibrio coralliirubri]|nr:hypothetical protein VCR6J2_610261 [Vibrio coralliirubri]
MSELMDSISYRTNSDTHLSDWSFPIDRVTKAVHQTLMKAVKLGAVVIKR